jgi:hypothetical protein
MALPEGFSHAKHLRGLVAKYQNKIIRAEFADIDDDDLEPTTDRRALRTGCLHQPDDSSIMTLNRLFLFYCVMKKCRDFQMPIYGIPSLAFQEQFSYKPQILLYFQEDYQDVEPGYAPITGEISFRLMNQESHTLTELELTSYANKIRTAFTSGNGFVWKKGKVSCTYTDKEKGYQLRLSVRDKVEGDRLIEQILDIQSHSPEADKTNYKENKAPSSAYPTIPTVKSILGKSRKQPRRRPTADVRFRYAVAHIYGLPNPIPLVDISHTFRKPLVKAS